MQRVVGDQRRRPGLHEDAPLGDGGALADVLVAHVDHARPAGGVDVAQRRVVRRAPRGLSHRCTTSRSCGPPPPDRAWRPRAVPSSGPRGPTRPPPGAAAGRRGRRRAGGRAGRRSLGGEEAGVEHALGRQPGPRAVAAEGLRDGRDDADLAAAVAVAPAPRDLAPVGGLDRLQRQRGVDAAQDLRARHDVVEAPAVAGAHVHVLDEAQAVAAAVEVPRQVDQRVVVDAAAHDGVDLDRRQAGRRRRVDAGQHLRDGRLGVVHGPEDGVVDAVQADGDAVEPRRREVRRLRRQQRAVGRQRDLQAGQGAQHRDQRRQAAAQQRLAARQAQLAQPASVQLRHDAGDLLEAEDLVAGQELEVGAEDLARHAVAAAEVAAVGDRHAQVAQGASQPIAQRGRCDWVVMAMPPAGSSPGSGLASQGRSRATSRTARPRWLMAFFSSRPNSAMRRPSGRAKTGS